VLIRKKKKGRMGSIIDPNVFSLNRILHKIEVFYRPVEAYNDLPQKIFFKEISGSISELD
jgi:hypothetical protein